MDTGMLEALCVCLCENDDIFEVVIQSNRFSVNAGEFFSLVSFHFHIQIQIHSTVCSSTLCVYAICAIRKIYFPHGEMKVFTANLMFFSTNKIIPFGPIYRRNFTIQGDLCR